MTSQVATPPETQTPPPVAEAEKDRHALFEYSRWISVGPGAAECDHAQDGHCKDQEHFHAWIRLPNAYQVRDIIEKSRAAAARRRRMLRDPESDAAVIMEAELDELRNEELRSILVDEVIDQKQPDHYVMAIRHVMSQDDEDATPDETTGDLPKLWENIEQDREEYERQLNLPEEERAEDFGVLEQRIADYSRAVEAALEEIRQPERETLTAKPLDDLIEMVRVSRIEDAAQEIYAHTFQTWEWFVCTYKPNGVKLANERVWKDLTQMKYEAAPAVIEALRENFRDLEAKLSRDRGLGN